MAIISSIASGNGRGARIACQFGVLAALGLVVAGCTNAGGGRTFVRGPAPAIQTAPPPAFSPIEGSWRHSEGLFNATFREGRFESISPQTGDRLAAGSYGTIGQDQVSLEFATARGNRDSAVCTLSGTVLNCSQSGSRSFQMVRA